MGVPIAADESVRKADDPREVARLGSADILVIKAQPLGGIHAALQLVADAGLPAVVSSALETSVGISMGLHLAGALPSLEYDCGLATGMLLTADVAETLPIIEGEVAVVRVTPASNLLDEYRASSDRTEWWMARLTRCYQLLAARSPR
jgi:o-succinylbenzoate synthase